MTTTITGATGIDNIKAATGAVLQVVTSTTAVRVASSTTSYTDSGLSASITPSSTSSKILVLVNQNGLHKNAGHAQNAISIALMRDATQVSLLAAYAAFTNTATPLSIGTVSTSYLDSPSTTSATVYKTTFANTITSSVYAAVQQDTQMSTITLMEIAG
tara:strand:+ start:241 stop:717 length:477 start_codon:yes stop_codon:yes gene_type:complete